MYKKLLFALLSIIAFCFTQLSAQPPAKYDLRDHDLVTRVKPQKGGTCWCHGTMSGIEGNLLFTGNWEAAGETGEPNMAEYHLDWWNGFSKCWNYDLYPECDTGSGTPTHSGGDYKIFLAYMSRLEGPIRETDAPGDAALQIPSQTAIPLYNDSFLIWYVPDINWYFIDGDGEQGCLMNIDTIKNVVIRNGVMPTNYLTSNDIDVFAGSYEGMYTHYQSPDWSGDANHSVAIIGWNDDVQTNAGSSQLGAWLCKNSWGMGTGKQDFFWISYYDKHCCRNAEMSVVSFHDVAPLPYTNVYYHDYHGWRDTLTIAKEAFNKFVANNEGDEFLIAVSFITTVDHEDWEVKVYDNFTDGELKDELASASGNIIHIGYHTRNLNTCVRLTKDDDFYIYVKFAKGFQAYDRTSSPPVLTIDKPRDDIIVWSKAEAGQSYYRTSADSEWLDFINYDDTTTWDGSGNFCIKGFTSDTLITEIGFAPEYPKTCFQLYNYPNPFTSHTTIKYSLMENSAVSLAIYNARGRKIRSLVKAQCNAGIHQIVWNGMDEFNKALSNGIYYSVLTVKTNRGSVTKRNKMFLLK